MPHLFEGSSSVCKNCGATDVDIHMYTLACKGEVKEVPASAMNKVKLKQSLYFPDAMLQEIRAEANRQDRSLSWLMQLAWSIAADRVRELPAHPPSG